ncbi:MAG: hypothetical protein IJ123_05060 [Blautia sp.]|nr:hypothetical protein [Blautia sp.]
MYAPEDSAVSGDITAAEDNISAEDTDGDGAFLLSYRFADKEEAAEFLLSNREYYENLNQKK